jgi:hypothetical protein
MGGIYEGIQERSWGTSRRFPEGYPAGTEEEAEAVRTVRNPDCGSRKILRRTAGRRWASPGIAVEKAPQNTYMSSAAGKREELM